MKEKKEKVPKAPPKPKRKTRRPKVKGRNTPKLKLNFAFSQKDRSKDPKFTSLFCVQVESVRYGRGFRQSVEGINFIDAVRYVRERAGLRGLGRDWWPPVKERNDPNDKLQQMLSALDRVIAA